MLIISIFFVILMLIVFSLKEKEIDFSEFELQRRIDTGDKRAGKMLNKKRFVPIYNYFLCYLGYVLMILSVISLAKVVDFYQSVLIILVVFLVSKVILSSDMLLDIDLKINRKIIPFFSRIYFAQNSRIQNKLSKIANKKQPWTFYSKEELLHFLEKNCQILDKNEQKWIGKIFEFKDETALKKGISSDKMAIIHTNDLLTPLIIDELFKTKQNIFPVMNSEETSVKGVIFLEDITKIDSSDSKKAQKVMRENFFSLKSDISALDTFEKMISKDKNYAILLEKNGDLAGIINLTDFIRKK